MAKEQCPCGCGRWIKGLHLRGAAAGYRRVSLVMHNIDGWVEQAIRLDPKVFEEKFRAGLLSTSQRGQNIHEALLEHLHGNLTVESLNMIELNREVADYEDWWRRFVAIE